VFWFVVVSYEIWVIVINILGLAEFEWGQGDFEFWEPAKPRFASPTSKWVGTIQLPRPWSGALNMTFVLFLIA